MSTTITSPRVTKLLDALYADAATNDAAVRSTLTGPREPDPFLARMRTAYLPVSRNFGSLLYTLVRAARPDTVVEFGTSSGVSTTFLAAAVRDNGKGKVVTSEYHAEKTERARKNLRDAGLEEHVEFRVGDARETLRDVAAPVGFVLLDGPKRLYLEVLQLLEPRLVSGSVVASDNTDHEGLDAFLAHVRKAEHGYLSSALLTGREGATQGHEVSIKA